LATRLGELPHAAAVLVVDRSTSSGHDFAVPRSGDVIDLLHAPTRVAVLLNVEALGVKMGQDWSRPWMLGAPWSPLDENQAARCVVAALQAIERGGAPPRGVLGAWPAAYQNYAGRWFQPKRPHVLGAARTRERAAVGVPANHPDGPLTVLAEQREREDHTDREAGFLLVGLDL
jgi:hypothetical protein